MAIASGSSHSLYYVEETTRGTTPTTPVFKTFRHTGTTLALTKEAFESNERGGRQVKCFRHGNKQVNGGTDYELSYGDFDDLLEAVTGGAWATDTPTAGTDQLKSGNDIRFYTIERDFEDISTRIRYTGCAVNEMSLTVAPNANVEGSFGFVGVDQDTDNDMVSGATYEDPTTQCPFDSFSGSISEGGSTIGVVTEITMSLNNGIANLFAVGSDAPVDYSIQRFRVEGTLTVYFENVTLLNKFINETSSTLEFTLTSEGGDDLKFSFPNIKYNGGQPDVSDDNEITLAMPFVGLYDATDESEIVIERTPAV